MARYIAYVAAARESRGGRVALLAFLLLGNMGVRLVQGVFFHFWAFSSQREQKSTPHNTAEKRRMQADISLVRKQL